jgi:hypothetical protein
MPKFKKVREETRKRRKPKSRGVQALSDQEVLAMLARVNEDGIKRAVVAEEFNISVAVLGKCV